MTPAESRLPVTLLTGFLGAGKTTLLNHLIRDPAAGRIAVVMNEFGDVGLDHDLIEVTTEETILLESGCLCCSIRGDLATTLAGLHSRRAAGELRFDRVVIETTGIADPGPVLHTLVASDLIAPHFRMDGVVTLADAAIGMQTLAQHQEAKHQIAVADLIVLNKTDLVSQADLAGFKSRLSALNPGAPQILARQGHVPGGALFGLSALREEAAPAQIANWLGQMPASPEADHGHSHDHDHHRHHDCGHDHAHAHGDDPHAGRIVSAAITVTEPIPPSVFDFWLDTLIALKGPDILRMKGLIHVAGMGAPFVFHGVQHIFDSPVPLTSWRGTDTHSKVVLIARDMTRPELEASLNMLRMKPKQVEVETDALLAPNPALPA